MRFSLIVFLLFCSLSLFAQRRGGGGQRQTTPSDNSYGGQLDTSKFDNTDKAKKKGSGIIKQARDFLMLDFGYYNWLSKPDTVHTKPIGYTFKAFLCYDFPIKRSKLSFATGLGISASAVYLNQMVLANTDTAAAYSSAARFLPDTTHYKRYKFVTAYLTAPFELRYFSNIQNRNRGFKAALGLQIGTLLGAHTKGVYSINGTSARDKIDTKRFVSPWDFAATARVGWGNFCFFGTYNLSTVFKVNAGPPITPLSIGFALTGL